VENLLRKCAVKCSSQKKRDDKILKKRGPEGPVIIKIK
jgi:hypothetical protein